MRAYNLCMLTICINAGFYIVGLMSMFGDLGTVGASNSFISLFNLFSNPIISVGGFQFRGIDLIAGALAVGTIVVLNSNAINDRGISYTLFAVVFWGSFFIASATLNSIDLPGISIVYMIYFLISVLIFVIALVQMPTGGQKAHV